MGGWIMKIEGSGVNDKSDDEETQPQGRRWWSEEKGEMKLKMAEGVNVRRWERCKEDKLKTRQRWRAAIGLAHVRTDWREMWCMERGRWN